MNVDDSMFCSERFLEGEGPGSVGRGKGGAKGCQQISVSNFWDPKMEVLEIR